MVERVTAILVLVPSEQRPVDDPQQVVAVIGDQLEPLREMEPERASDQRAKCVARLMTELGSNIRLVHGTAAGLIGNIGSQERFHYGVLLPGFARYLTALTALEFGQSAEMRPT